MAFHNLEQVLRESGGTLGDPHREHKLPPQSDPLDTNKKTSVLPLVTNHVPVLSSWADFQKDALLIFKSRQQTHTNYLRIAANVKAS